MAIKYYQDQAEELLKEYVLADPVIPYVSVVGGIFACKMVYDLTQLVSSVYFKSYSSLSKFQRTEWNNRAMSTLHAVFITVLSLYLVFWSDLYSDAQLTGLVTFRNSPFSTFVLGVSVGYFIADLGMIFWFYPALGGLEYVIHHLLSIASLTYAMLTGEGQLYTYLVARILLFVYLFYHVYLHYDQVKQMHSLGKLLVLVVPLVLTVMNLMWFLKIFKGMKKTLAKRQ
ncbi:hypothetical protein UlMin_013950 [Ulmus minor]